MAKQNMKVISQAYIEATLLKSLHAVIKKKSKYSCVQVKLWIQKYLT